MCHVMKMKQTSKNYTKGDRGVYYLMMQNVKIIQRLWMTI